GDPFAVRTDRGDREIVHAADVPPKVRGMQRDQVDPAPRRVGDDQPAPVVVDRGPPPAVRVPLARRPGRARPDAAAPPPAPPPPVISSRPAGWSKAVSVGLSSFWISRPVATSQKHTPSLLADVTTRPSRPNVTCQGPLSPVCPPRHASTSNPRISFTEAAPSL